ncbi:MAG TPA: hypothetical protein ENI23_14500 [bacterium]|nr:hypothetical protein [bacterium]
MAVTNEKIYNAINDLRKEVKSDMKDLRKEVDVNTHWRDKITGKLTVIFVAIGVAINFLMDWGRDKLSSKV